MFGALWTELLQFTFADLYDAHNDDETEGEELACGENILNTRRPADTGAVNPG